VAVGTDSLASVEDLNLFSELKVMRWLAASVPARDLLESATLTGARALGLDPELGSLTPGKRAEIVQVDVPSDIDDVEEYLVSGVPAHAIDWAAHTRDTIGREDEEGGGTIAPNPAPCTQHPEPHSAPGTLHPPPITKASRRTRHPARVHQPK
jgi:hypothetical protein